MPGSLSFWFGNLWPGPVWPFGVQRLGLAFWVLKATNASVASAPKAMSSRLGTSYGGATILPQWLLIFAMSSFADESLACIPSMLAAARANVPHGLSALKACQNPTNCWPKVLHCESFKSFGCGRAAVSQNGAGRNVARHRALPSPRAKPAALSKASKGCDFVLAARPGYSQLFPSGGLTGLYANCGRFLTVGQINRIKSQTLKVCTSQPKTFERTRRSEFQRPPMSAGHRERDRRSPSDGLIELCSSAIGIKVKRRSSSLKRCVSRGTIQRGLP